MPATVETSTRSSHPSLLRRAMRRLLRRAPADPGVHEEDIIRQSGMFDASWYLERYPDVAASGMDPIMHYVRHGASEGRNPSATFDTAFYLARHADVAASGMNPFRHYVEFGHGEKRAAMPARKRASARKSDAEVIAEADALDRKYYLATYPDVSAAGMDPVAHYLEHGAAEGRNPSAVFDTRYYMASNPDVAASGMNPLVHFCRYGSMELRNPSAKFDMAWYWLTQLAESSPMANPLTHYLTVGRKAGLEIREADKLSAEDEQSLIDICEHILEQKGHTAHTIARVGMALTRISRWAEAERCFRDAVALHWDNARGHERLARALAKQGKWWQVVESLEQAITLDPGRAVWFYRLGEALEKMNRFAQAADAYQQAIDLDARDAGWFYRLGYVLEKSEQLHRAEQAYAEALKRDGRKGVKQFGVGMLHQLRGYWPEAAEAYERELEYKPFDAELRFRCGMAYDRCYRWADAERAYHAAISLKRDIPYWHYRYGFVLERQERYTEAAEAYAAAAMLSSEHKPYWHYRRGYVLEQVGEHERACYAYIQSREKQTLLGEIYCPNSTAAKGGERSSPTMAAREGDATGHKLIDSRSRESDIENQGIRAYLARFQSEAWITRAIASNATDPDFHYRLGEVCEWREDWRGAAKAYAAAVARSNAFRGAWYYRLGFVLFRDKHFKEACMAFRENCIFRLPYGVDTSAYSKDPVRLRGMRYREYMKVLPILQKTILYESTHGASIGGNPRAIFEYLLDQDIYRDWTHVWVVTKDVVIPSDMRSRSNVILVDHGSDLYCRYLATVSHLVNDSTFPYWFSRRSEQKYLNTWHGTPLKKLGKAIPSNEDLLPHRNIQRNLLHATHVISPNHHTSDVLMNDFDVRGIYSGKLAETGYPRIDRTLNACPERVASIRKRLNLDCEKPVALYAPTWRGVLGDADLDLEKLRGDLEVLAQLPCQWLFRGHPFSENLLRDEDMPVTLAPPEISTADILAICDILVTDYSSIFFDFLPTRRPIFYYCYDLEEYTRDRGMYFDIHDMPGITCTDIKSLADRVSEQLNDMEKELPNYEKALEKFSPHEDGGATGRVVAFFIDDDDSHTVNRYRCAKPSLLFFGGHFAPNGISASFLNMMSALHESGRCQLSVAVEPLRIKREPIWRERFHELPESVTVLGRVGSMVTSAEQAWVAARFRSCRSFTTAEMRDIFASAYQDEYRRCYGDARVDIVIDFDGYNGFWSALFGLGLKGSGKRNVCWLHSDFFEEFLLRYPNLKSQFSFFPGYETLVSVSKSVNEANRNHLLPLPGTRPSQFVYCNNLIGVNSVIKKSLEPLPQDIDAWLGDSVVIGTLARLSPEKDHQKLISAFHRVLEEVNDDVRLVIAGDGPLRENLQAQINRLGLQKRVLLAGQLVNPYPLLKRLDIFAFSSNYEGQGVAILEALVMGKRVVSTDVVGPRTILEGGYGLLVENSEDGLAKGLIDTLRKDVQYRGFNSVAYEDQALKMLESAIGLGGGTSAC